MKIYLVMYVSSMYANFQFFNITRILGYELPLCQHGIMEVSRNQWIPAGCINPKSLCYVSRYRSLPSNLNIIYVEIY